MRPRKRVAEGRRFSTRAREDAELARVAAHVAAIPSLAAVSVAVISPAATVSSGQLVTAAAAAMPVRRNRRQQRLAAAAASAAVTSPSKEHHEWVPPIPKAIPAARRFADLPLSTRTLDGLAAAEFVQTTDVQRIAIPQALAGRDILAAAPTGSGKTLAFVVPVLEALWRNKWSTFDGLGALILAPTRELALQIFDVLRTVGRNHTVSAGLVIGGKDIAFEREKVGRMNILVATPGRMLHHMDHVAELDCSALKVLVLDEADRILDMGFAPTLDAILQNIPKNGRQTLLFSATQTKSVKALARLSLRSPEYVSVTAVAPTSMSKPSTSSPASEDKTDPPDEHPAAVPAGPDTPRPHESDSEDGNSAHGVRIVGTPRGLTQSFVLLEHHEKLSVLWSFIKTHLQSKTIVFLATGKQVRFVFESFCKLRPGVPLLHIHGNMKQLRRTEMYDQFCRTRSAVLFATDVASRGLDFPEVEWVVQVDCPDDVSSYVHRVGRTARFAAHGRAMLFLANGPEEIFLRRLEKNKLQLNRVRINPERTASITPRIAAVVASNQELKKLGQRALTFYLKSIVRQRDKEVFDALCIDYKALALSFGLSLAPVVTIKGTAAGIGASGRTESLSEKSSNRKSIYGYRSRVLPRDDAVAAEEGTTKVNPSARDVEEVRNVDHDDDILTLKRVHKYVEEEGGSDFQSGEHDGSKPGDASDATLVRRRAKRLKLDRLKSGPSLSNRIVFTEDGKAIRASEAAVGVEELGLSTLADADDNRENSEGATAPGGIKEYAAQVSRRLELSSHEDKDREHERVKKMHHKAKTRSRNPLLVGQQEDIRNAYDVDEDDMSDAGEDAYGESDDEFQSAIARIAAGATRERGSSDTEDSSSSSVQDSPKRSTIEDEEALALRIIQQRQGVAL